jgi:hypothetical protein
MKKTIDFLTPTEVIEKYPELADKFGWNPKDIGIFFKCRLLLGYFDPSFRKSMIKEESIKRLVHFVNEQLEKQKVKV